MLGVVILLGVLIVLALGLVVVGIVSRLNRRGSHPASYSESAALTLAPGMRFAAMEVAADRLVLRLHGPAGDEIDIIDITSGRLVAKVREAAPPHK